MTRRLFSEASAVVLGQILVAVVSLAALRAVTEVLDPAAFGQAALILAALALAKGVFVSPALAAQLRFHPMAEQQESLTSLYRTVVTLMIGSSLVATMILLPVTYWLSAVVTPVGLATLSLLILSWLIVDGLLGVELNYLNAELRQWTLSIGRVTDALLRPGSGITAAVLVRASAPVYVAGRTLGALLGSIFLAALIGRPRTHKTRAHAAGVGAWGSVVRRYALPLMPLAGVQWAVHLGDRYILELFHGSREVGLYSAAYGLASQPFVMLSGAATLLLRPRLFAAGDRDSPASIRYRRLWLSLVVLSGSLGLLVLLVARKPLAALLLAPAYRDVAAGLLAIVGLAYLGLAIGQSIENWLLADRRTDLVLYAGLISMLVSLAAALAWIPEYAEMGAAWATVLGLGTYPVVLAIAYLRQAP